VESLVTIKSLVDKILELVESVDREQALTAFRIAGQYILAERPPIS
jgi:hypothetical protein